MTTTQPHIARLYATSLANGKHPCIHLLNMDTRTGKLSLVQSTREGTTNAFHFTLDARRRRMYVVDMVKQFADEKGGAMQAFAIEPESGALTYLGGQPAGDTAPCFTTLTSDGQHLLCTGYGEGKVAMFPITADGAIGKRSSLVSHADPALKATPRAHSILPDPTGRLLFSPDLGVDRVMIHQSPPVGDCNAVLKPHDPPYFDMPAKSGPRHLAWHPNGRFLFVITEYGNTIASLAYDPARGALTAVQIESTLPAGFTGKSFCADVQVHPNGRFVYGTNRGHQSVVEMAVDPDTGKLQTLGHCPSGGNFPQAIRFDPTSQWMLIANMKSDRIVTFKVDPQTGRMADVGLTFDLPQPSAMVFV